MFPISETAPRRGVPLITWGLILLNVLVFGHEWSLSETGLERFINTFGMVPERITQGSLLTGAYWPFLTMMFVHGGWLHLLGNMWTLYLFGDNVEGQMGSSRFLVFYLLCGFAAAFVQYYGDPTSSLPNIGASGAIAGVMGAYLILFPTARVVTLFPVFIFPLFFEIPAIFYLGFWYLAQLWNGAVALHAVPWQGGIAWGAHVGGFGAGIALLPVFLWDRRSPPPEVPAQRPRPPFGRPPRAAQWWEY